MRNLNDTFERLRHFIRVWRTLARYYFVDEWGSAEQRRVLFLWNVAGRPLPCRAFILRHANAAPEVKS